MAKPLGIVAMLTRFKQSGKASVTHHFNQFDTIMKEGHIYYVCNTFCRID